MLTTNQFWTTMSPVFNSDNLCLSSPDLISDDEYDFLSTIDDDMILNDVDITPEIDQYQQRTSSSSSSSPSSGTVLSHLICGVCGAPATGYNFDQITCESCKAFFRRNALRTTSNLRCRFSGSCVININTRRQCTYCRLKKCFDIKMRKDWIRTEEETKLRQLQKLVKQQRKGRDAPVVNLPIVVRKKKRLMFKPMIEELVTNPIFTPSFFGLHRNLSNEDHVLLNNITNAYRLAADMADYSHVMKYTQSASLLQFINDEHVMHGSLIQFYKAIPEFKQFDIEDRILLIKSNLRNTIHLHYIIVQNFEDSPHIGKLMSNWIDADFHRQMARTRQYFYRFMKYPLLLKLSLIVFIFSTNLSATTNLDQPNKYINEKKLFECENHYSTILWRYLNHLFGEKEAIRAMAIIVTQILQYQVLMVKMEGCVRQTSREGALHSLMKSIFGLG